MVIVGKIFQIIRYDYSIREMTESLFHACANKQRNEISWVNQGIGAQGAPT
jgi:hypothetical protein